MCSAGSTLEKSPMTLSSEFMVMKAAPLALCQSLDGATYSPGTSISIGLLAEVKANTLNTLNTLNTPNTPNT